MTRDPGPRADGDRRHGGAGRGRPGPGGNAAIVRARPPGPVL